MSWITGFWDLTLGTDASHSALLNMVDALGKDNSDTLTSKSTSNAGVAALGTNANVVQDGNFIVALEGRPRWSHSRYSDLATQSAAKAIVYAFQECGTDFLQHLHGNFALAIIAPGQKLIFLAVDRLGIRPLAYHMQNERLIFSSRLDGIRAYPGTNLSLNPQSLFHYLYFHMVPSPDTIYQGCHKLQPGHYVLMKNGQLTTQQYWQPSYAEELNLTDATRMLKCNLDVALDRNLQSEDHGHIGAFLSGGLDSSTVVGLLAKASPADAHAYTIGFHAEGYDEVPFARASAEHYHATLHSYYVTPEDVVTAIPLVARSYDEPFGNASAAAAYFCAKAAKENGKDILLAGDGGDELFAGNARYATQLIFERYHQIPGPFRSLLENVLTLTPARDRLPLVKKISSYIRQAKMPLPERLESYNFLKRQPLADILHPDLFPLIDAELPERLQRDTFNDPKDADILKRMLYLDLKFTLADNDLRKVNRMCEIAGVEVRYPLLDEELVEFSTKIPSHKLLENGELRAFYKHALTDFLPPGTLSKKKHGFGLPFGVWMAQHHDMRELALDSLNNLRSRSIVNPDYLDNIITLQRDGHAAYYGVMIWILVMLEQWLQARQL